MKYKVMGANRSTGARMTLEFEAESKGAAERKAHQAGMEVHRVVDVTEGDGTTPPPESGRGGRRTGMHPVAKLILLLVLAAVAYYVVWPMVRGGG